MHFRKIIILSISIFFLFFQIALSGIPIGYVASDGETNTEAVENCFREAIGKGLQSAYRIKNGSELYKYITQQEDLKQFIERPAYLPTASKSNSGRYVLNENFDLDKGEIDAVIRKFVNQLFVNEPSIAISFIVTSYQSEGNFTNIFHELAKKKVNLERKNKDIVVRTEEMETDLYSTNEKFKDKVRSIMKHEATNVNNEIKKLLSQYNIYTKKIFKIDEWFQEKNTEAFNKHSENVEILTNEFIKEAIKMEQNIDILIFGVVNIYNCDINKDIAELSAEVNGSIILDVDGDKKDLPVRLPKITKRAKGKNCTGKAMKSVYHYAARSIFYNNILSELSQIHNKHLYRLVFHNIENDMKLQTEIFEILKQLGPLKDIRGNNGNIEVKIKTSISNAVELKLSIYNQMDKKMKSIFQNIKTSGPDVIIFQNNYSNTITPKKRGCLLF